MLLIAAGSLWLFLAAVPVLADGGPHVASAKTAPAAALTTDAPAAIVPTPRKGSTCWSGLSRPCARRATALPAPAAR